MSTLVKPEYGPTLAELSGPRWPKVRIALLVLAVLVAVWLAVKWFGGSDSRKVIVVKGPVAINLLRNPGLQQIAPNAGEELRLRSTVTGVDQSFAVSPFTLPPYAGPDPGGVMPVYAANVIRRLEAADPSFRLRSEGRARVNLYPGYAITYDTVIKGQRWYGKRIYLWPDVPAPKQGVQIDLLAKRGMQGKDAFVMPGPNSVGQLGPTKLPLRSFNFGTERPK